MQRWHNMWRLMFRYMTVQCSIHNSENYSVTFHPSFQITLYMYERIKILLLVLHCKCNSCRLPLTIVNPGNCKSKNSAVAIDVESTVTLHNLLFLVRKLVANKLVETFNWLSCRKKCSCQVLCRVKAKKANKNMKRRNLTSSFITIYIY